MFIQSDAQQNTEKLASRVARSREASAGLFADIVAGSSRLLILKAAGTTARLDRLVASDAWTDAALQLMALDVPMWSLQRLCLDEAEWNCTLTRFPLMPEWLDDCAEGRHASLALAILSAILDARAKTSTATDAPTCPTYAPGHHLDDASL